VASPAAADDPNRGGYERMKEQARARNAALSKSGREIGPLPPVRDPERRRYGLEHPRHYCEVYKRGKFFWAWSPDHITALERGKECAERGGLFAIAMMRGGGKTELCKGVGEWAILKGLRHFAALIGATQQAAVDLLRDVKNNFETNDLLLEDFPEVCWPIRCLDGITNRAKGQRLDDQPTKIVWTDDEIRLPLIPGSACSWSIIIARGITGAIRGQNRSGPKGEAWRPDFAIADDVQTRESAKSFEQTNDRELIVQGDLVEMAGPGTKIACLMPCTVIYPGDLADRFLDREEHPDWRGERFQALYALPTNQELWDRYAEIRRDSFRAGGDGSEATAFYAANREAMDAGSQVAWPQRMKPGEISGLQCCMNVKIDKPETFAAEWQNEPEGRVDVAELRQLTEDDLVAKLNQAERGLVPRDCGKLTAFIDVQSEVLFWAICAWSDKFGGALVDYGAWPAQARAVFTAAEPARRLSDEYPQMEARARIYAGLSALVPQLLGRHFRQQDAEGMLTVSLCLIDAGFETDTIHDFIARSPLKAVLKASKGRYVGAAGKPMNEYRKDPGDLVGWNWRIDARTTAKGRFVSFDANAWKSIVAEGLLAPPGSASSIYLFGQKITQHPLLVQHLLSEYRVPTWGGSAGSGKVIRPDRRVDEWRGRPEHRENHWWDGLVGCAVAASVLGLAWSAATAAGDATPTPQKKRVKWSEKYKQRHAQRPAA
jgi:hypothetical protein